MHHRYNLLLIASLVLTACSAGANPDPLTERSLSGGLLEVGAAEAPVTMTLFINHDSPYSQRFFRELLPRLTQDRVQSATVRIGFVPVAFKKYPKSDVHAAMLYCAMQQGKGQAMNDLLFGITAAGADFKKQLKIMGIDGALYDACLKSPTLQMTLAAQEAMAAERDVTLVPTYFINDKKYVGLPEYADLRGQIEEEMN